MTVLDLHGTRRKYGRVASYRRAMANQLILKPARAIEPRERERLPGPRHGHIVEPPRCVQVFAASDAVPVTVEYRLRGRTPVLWRGGQ